MAVINFITIFKNTELLTKLLQNVKVSKSKIELNKNIKLLDNNLSVVFSSGGSRSYKEEVRDSIQAVKVSKSSPKNKKKIAYLRRKEAARNKAKKSIKRLKNTELSLKRNRSQKNKNQYGYRSKKKYSRIKNKKNSKINRNSKRKRSESSSNKKPKKKKLVKKIKSLSIQ